MGAIAAIVAVPGDDAPAGHGGVGEDVFPVP